LSQRISDIPGPLHQTGAAMHKAKRSGRNHYQVYGSGDESMALAAIPRERWLATGLPCLHRPASARRIPARAGMTKEALINVMPANAGIQQAAEIPGFPVARE
jgi:hypothetical protein